MYKFNLLIICSILSVSFATTSTWYPENGEEIAKKCSEENNATPETEKNLQMFNDTPEMRSVLLCRTKAMNIYSEETGFYVDRMASYFYETAAENKKHILQDCVDKNKDLTTHTEKVYKTIECVYDTDKDFKKLKNHEEEK